MSKNTVGNIKKIFADALERVNPYTMIKEHIWIEKNILKVKTEDHYSSINLNDFDEVVVTGAGKASARMALAIEEIFGSRISRGLLSVKEGHTEKLETIKLIEAGHPVPDLKSVEAGKAISELAEAGNEKTLFINILSGGGSALLEKPVSVNDGNKNYTLTLGEIQETTKLLLACGADIRELNCIRKHLSDIKGGIFARKMYPSFSINLILSDVTGDRLDTIASGLTVGDETTFNDAMGHIKKYNLEKKVPANVLAVLEAGCAGKIPDTPKKGDKIFSKVLNVLIGTNYAGLVVAGETAESLGYNTLILSSQIEGEAKEAASFYAAIARDIRKHSIPVKTPACIIAGGETTVTIKGDGKGGRNQEMALAFLSLIEKDPEAYEGIYFLSAATDGNDGPTDASGGFASLEVLEDAKRKSLKINEYLNNNDSYNFLDRSGWLFKTGPTNTNVCDYQIIIIENR